MWSKALFWIFLRIRSILTPKVLLACRPPLNRRLRQLPVIGDFMGFDENGKMIEKVASVEEALKNVEVKPEETVARFAKLQSAAAYHGGEKI